MAATYLSSEEFQKIVSIQFGTVSKTDSFKSACCNYQDNGYEICEKMRCGDTSADADVKDISSKFQTITIPKESKESKHLVLYRGIEALYNTDLKTGDYISKAFSSTSTCPRVATTFVSIENKQETCCLMHIHIPAGTSISILPICNGNGFKENEVVLAPNYRFHVIRDTKLLNEIQIAMSYDKNDGKVEDWFASIEGSVISFNFTIFEKDGIKIIPVTISQVGSGGRLERSNYKRTNKIKLVLGKTRIIYSFNEGRKEYILYNRTYLSIIDARKLEKKKSIQLRKK